MRRAIIFAIIASSAICHKKNKLHKPTDHPEKSSLGLSSYVLDDSSPLTSSYTSYSTHTLFTGPTHHQGTQPSANSFQPGANQPYHSRDYFDDPLQGDPNSLPPFLLNQDNYGYGQPNVPPSITSQGNFGYGPPNVLPPIYDPSGPSRLPGAIPNEPVNPYFFLPPPPPVTYHGSIEKHRRRQFQRRKKKPSVLKRVLGNPVLMLLLGGISGAFLFPTLIREEVNRSSRAAARAIATAENVTALTTTSKDLLLEEMESESPSKSIL